MPRKKGIVKADKKQKESNPEQQVGETIITKPPSEKVTECQCSSCAHKICKAVGGYKCEIFGIVDNKENKCKEYVLLVIKR